MALSGYLETNAYKGRYYRIDWSATQNIESNTSTVYWEISAWGGSSDWLAERTLKVWVGGLVYEKYNRVERYQGKITSGYITVNHDKLGNANLYLGIDAAVYNSSITCTGEYTYSLNTIARASQPSCITWPETTTHVGDIGSTITVHMNRVSTSFLHYCYCYWGGRRFEVGSGNIENYVQWSLPMDMCNDIPCNTTGSGTIYCDTYQNGTFIGQKTVGFTASVPSSVEPTMSFSYSDETKNNEKYGDFVQGYSKLKVDVVAAGDYGSSITDYYNTYDGAVGYQNSNSFDMPNSGNQQIFVNVTDSRGRSVSSSADINVIPYYKPVIKELKAYRVNDTGEPYSYGNNFKIDFSCSVAPINNKNTATYKVKYKKKTDTNYQEIVLKEQSNKYEVTGSYIFKADTVSYDIQLEVVDDFNTTTKQLAGTAVKKFMSWFKKGMGIAFGKVAELANTLEVDWETRLNKQVYIQNEPLADFVIEQGKNGVWDYRKWNSGKCELWLNTICETTIDIAWGVLFSGQKTEAYSYPFEYNDVPLEVCHMSSSTYGVISYTDWNGANTTTSSGQYAACRPVAVNEKVAVNLNIYVCGYIKTSKAGETKNAN